MWDSPALENIAVIACVVTVFIFEWFHPTSAKDLEIIIPAILGVYHVGKKWAGNKDNDNGSN